MEYTLYAYQVSPGRDEVLHFSDTFEGCREAALEQREDLRRHETDGERVDAMAVYRCRLRVPDLQIMIDVMNNPDSENALFRACVVDRQLVAVVAD